MGKKTLLLLVNNCKSRERFFQPDVTIVVPWQLSTGSKHVYLFCYCPLVGILFEVLRIIWSAQMVICFPVFYIKLYIICTVQMVILYVLNYTHMIRTHSYACIIIHYISSPVMSLYKKRKFVHGQTFI